MKMSIPGSVACAIQMCQIALSAWKEAGTIKWDMVDIDAEDVTIAGRRIVVVEIWNAGMGRERIRCTCETLRRETEYGSVWIAHSISIRHGYFLGFGGHFTGLIFTENPKRTR